VQENLNTISATEDRRPLFSADPLGSHQYIYDKFQAAAEYVATGKRRHTNMDLDEMFTEGYNIIVPRAALGRPVSMRPPKLRFASRQFSTGCRLEDNSRSSSSKELN
jgi:hypothetical protein